MISSEESRLAENMYMHLCFHFWIVIPFRSRSFARSLARRLANHVTRQLSPHPHTGYLGPKSVCWLRTWSPGIAPGVLSVCGRIVCQTSYSPTSFFVHDDDDDYDELSYMSCRPCVFAVAASACDNTSTDSSSLRMLVCVCVMLPFFLGPFASSNKTDLGIE